MYPLLVEPVAPEDWTMDITVKGLKVGEATPYGVKLEKQQFGVGESMDLVDAHNEWADRAHDHHFKLTERKIYEEETCGICKRRGAHPVDDLGSFCVSCCAESLRKPLAELKALKAKLTYNADGAS